MIADIRSSFGMEEIPFRLMQQLAKVPRKKVHDFFFKTDPSIIATGKVIIIQEG